MIENRDLTLDDYLAMLRRRMKMILIPALLAPLVGFLISYFFTAKYTSQSLVLVEGQKVPEGVVQPVVTADLAQRIATMQQQVLGRNRLQPIVEKRPNLFRGGRNLEDVLEDVRNGVQIEPAILDPRVRAALYHALDRDALSDAVNGGNPQLAAWSILSASDPFYGQIETAYSHRIASGYVCGEDCLEFRPGNNATRGQIAKIVYEALQAR